MLFKLYNFFLVMYLMKKKFFFLTIIRIFIYLQQNSIYILQN